MKTRCYGIGVVRGFIENGVRDGFSGRVFDMWKSMWETFWEAGIWAEFCGWFGVVGKCVGNVEWMDDWLRGWFWHGVDK